MAHHRDGINDRGQVGGAYYDSMGAAFPFIYDITSDSFEEITAPTSGNYVVTSMNDAGDAIVFGMRNADESYADLRSFYRDGRTGAMTELFFPGAVETYGYDIDDQGTIIGVLHEREWRSRRISRGERSLAAGARLQCRSSGHQYAKRPFGTASVNSFARQKVAEKSSKEDVPDLELLSEYQSFELPDEPATRIQRAEYDSYRAARHTFAARNLIVEVLDLENSREVKAHMPP